MTELKRYKAILFDLDGTLMDTIPGIIHCYKHALTAIGYPEPTEEYLRGVIGAPLLDVFKSHFDLDGNRAREAVDIYRAQYAKEGVKKTRLYNGIKTMLSELRDEQYLLGVATLKAEPFAKSMLINAGVSDYFGIIKGIDELDENSKSSIMNRCMEYMDVSPKETVLVGDSTYDAEAAVQLGVDFIAALYGYGFKNEDDASCWNPIFILDTPLALRRLLG